MATRASAVISTQLDAYAVVFEWTGLLASDDGAWVLLGHYNDKSIHVYGTFNGASVAVEGSNELVAGATNAVALRTNSETVIAITAKDIRQVLENPLWVRVKVTGGDGATSLTAHLVCRH